MGYYTSFVLTVRDATPEESAEIEKLVSNEDGMCFMERWGEDIYTAYTTWYDYDEDMLALSKQYPTVLFELYGDGEETEDIWYNYYKNGMKQRCPAKITFDPYDEAKLKEPA